MLADCKTRLVAELITTNVDLLITHGTPGTRAAKQATTTIPIVMAISGDAIATGLVSSLARPEGNLTGSTFFLPQLNAKRLELLKEACPRISRPAALSNPDNPVSRPIIPAMQAAAASLSLIVEVVRAQSPTEFGLAFAASRGAGSSVGGRSQNRKKELPRARVRPTKEVKEYRGDFLAAWVNPSSGARDLRGFQLLHNRFHDLARVGLNRYNDSVLVGLRLLERGELALQQRRRHEVAVTRGKPPRN